MSNSKINQEFNNTYFHSVKLDKDLCKGCTRCLQKCPTEAIRVRNSKAKIIKERCIDCGECLKACTHHAKIAVTDSLDMLKNYKYNIALPAPSLYGQFRNIDNIDKILTALIKIGFDDVFEVTLGAQIISELTVKLLKENKIKRPVINSACPAIVRLIQQRYPDLIDHILPLKSPAEAAAQLAKNKAVEKTGLNEEEIGVFFISPCAAKMTAVINPIGSDFSYISGVLSMKDIVNEIAPFVHKITEYVVTSASSASGIAWANSGGEVKALKDFNCISVDGIHNVYKVMEDVEDEQLDGVDFVECSACVTGCVGGPLTVENAYIARTKINELSKKCKSEQVQIDITDDNLLFDKEIEYMPITPLGESMNETIVLLEKIRKLCDTLPQLDCGSCGAPTCHALAEDIVRGFAKESDCILKFKEKIKLITNEINELD